MVGGAAQGAVALPRQPGLHTLHVPVTRPSNLDKNLEKTIKIIFILSLKLVHLKVKALYWLQ